MRAVLILLALVLIPSIATASYYQCAIDGTVHSSCCCPTSAHRDKTPSPAPTSVKAACCCTVSHATTASRTERMVPATELPLQVALPVVVTTIAPIVVATSDRRVDRPRAQGDPSVSLFDRHCSRLL